MRRPLLSFGSRWRGLRFIAALSGAAALHSVGAVEAPTEARFLANTRQLIFEGRRSGEGYFSADGNALVLQSERERDNPYYQIRLRNSEPRNGNRVSPRPKVGDIYDCTFAPVFVNIVQSLEFIVLRGGGHAEVTGTPEEQK